MASRYFIAHDAGHIGITHNYQIDNIFGMLIADWFGGLSLGWWKEIIMSII